MEKQRPLLNTSKNTTKNIPMNIPMNTTRNTNTSPQAEQVSCLVSFLKKHQQGFFLGLQLMKTLQPHDDNFNNLYNISRWSGKSGKAGSILSSPSLALSLALSESLCASLGSTARRLGGLTSLLSSFKLSSTYENLTSPQKSILHLHLSRSKAGPGSKVFAWFSIRRTLNFEVHVS